MPQVKGLCLAKTTGFNRAVGEYVCAAVQESSENPERVLRCPLRGVVLDTINTSVTAEVNRSAGYAQDDPRYAEIHDMTVERDATLVGQTDFADNCLTIDDHLPRTGPNSTGHPYSA